jgi:hypothetical protein
MNKQTIKLGESPSSGSVSEWLEEAFQSIDAGIFSGDAFESQDALARFDYFVARWQRGLVNARAHVDLETNAEQSLSALATGAVPDLHAVFVERAEVRDGQRRGTFHYYLEVHADEAAAKEASNAYEVFDLPASAPLYYIPCSSYVAPGYHKGKLINVVNRDDDKPEVGFPDEMIEAEDQPVTAEPKIYAVAFQNFESEKLMLTLYAEKSHADEFYMANKHRPVTVSQIVVPNRCAVAVLIGHDLNLFPHAFDGKLVEIINRDDIMWTSGNLNTPAIEPDVRYAATFTPK